jgi:hypothetical protein
MSYRRSGISKVFIISIIDGSQLDGKEAVNPSPDSEIYPILAVEISYFLLALSCMG